MKRKIILLACVIFSMITHISTAQTNVPGGILSNLTWNLAGSPYLIQGTIQVPSGSTLTIEPGVTVNFQGTYKLLVQGRLLAIGTAANVITFTAANTTTGWRGIRFDNTPSTNDSSIFDYCLMQYGKAYGPTPENFGGAMYINNFSKIRVSNSSIVYCAANNDGGGFYIKASSPAIKNNIISNNIINDNGVSSGAGIYIFSGNPLINNNTISNNLGNCSSGSGGGISVQNGNAIISNNTITNNKNNSGGGIALNMGSVTITNNVISNNTARMGGGGGISMESGMSFYTNTIYNNTINNNTAQNNGGGISCRSGSNMFFDKNIITNNTAPTGGGIDCYTQSNVTISNNLISNNTATMANYAIMGGGGISFINCAGNTTVYGNIITNNNANFGAGIHVSSSWPSLTNNTIANNKALVKGGAMVCNTSNPVLKNCILYGNTAGTSGAQVLLIDESSDPTFTYSDIEGGAAAFDVGINIYTGTYQNSISNNPLFVAPTTGSGTGFNGVTANWALQSTSPCINQGDPVGTYPAFDIAGNIRVKACRIDIGALEFQTLTTFGVTVNASQPATCGALGSAQAVVTGGNAPYTYLWSNGQTTPTIANLAEGTYTLIVTDNTGCTTAGSAVITNPSPVVAAISITNATCTSFGSITVTPAGGTTPYTYAWSNGQTTQTINNISAGSYSVLITSNNGCSKTVTASITGKPLTATSAITNATCGGANGSITLNIISGTSPYTVQWMNGNTVIAGQTGLTLSNIIAGTYSAAITDGSGCSLLKPSIVVSNLDFSVTIAKADISCYGLANGSAMTIVTNNIPGVTFAYNWSNGATTPSIQNCNNSTYHVVVSVPNNAACNHAATVQFTNPRPISVTLANSKTNLRCSEQTGLLQVNVNGAYNPAGYSYIWSHNSSINLPTVSNLYSGNYTVTVVSPTGCKVTKALTVATSSAAYPHTLTLTKTDAVNGLLNGSITTSMTNIYPYAWTWTNGASTANVSNLSPGAYSVTVTAGSGACKTVGNSTILNNPLNLSFTKNDVCGTSANGQATVTGNLTGGTYTYQWSNGATTQTISNLMAGPYSVIVTFNGVGFNTTQTATVTINAATNVLAISSVYKIDATNNLCSGSATALAFGGSLPYSFKWYAKVGTTFSATPFSQGASATVSALCGGDIKVVVTDACGATAEKIFTIVNLGPPPTRLANPEESNNSETTETIQEDFSFVCFPNPYKENTNIQYSISKVTKVSVEVYNILGATVTTLVSNENQSEGTYSYPFSASSLGLENGIYLVRLVVGDKVYTKRIIEAK